MNNTTHPRTTRPINNRMPMRQGPGAGYGVSVDTPKHENVVLRREIGEVLRGVRQHQGRTLREVSSQARVSLGYLSEVERGQKEASSELLASICAALDVPLSTMLGQVAERDHVGPDRLGIAPLTGLAVAVAIVLRKGELQHCLFEFLIYVL